MATRDRDDRLRDGAPSSPPSGRDGALLAAWRESDASEPIEDATEDPEVGPALPSAAIASRAAAGPTPREVSVSARTEREIWQLAWPVIFSQMLASIVSLVDIGMVGRLERNAVAAVGYTTQYLNLAQSALFAVGIACVALIARAIGARDVPRARAALAASLLVAAGLACVFTAAMLAAPHFWLDLLGATPDVAHAAVPYFLLTLGSALLLAVSITIESGFRAVKNTRVAMGIAVVVTVAKTALNALLMFGALGLPRLELVGAGLATVISQAIAFVLFVVAARRGGNAGVMRLGLADFRAARGILADVVRISLPAVGERVILNVAILSYFTVLSHYGTIEIATYTIGVRLLSFSWIPGTGFSVAAATLVGQSLGAGQPQVAARAGWRAARLALVVAIVLGLGFGLAREAIARVFTSDLGVVEALGPFMLLLALAQPPMGVHFTLGGALRGAGDTWTPLIAATLGNWAFRVPIALLGKSLELDIVWVWAALIADHFARALWLTVAFRRGRWQEKRLGPR